MVETIAASDPRPDLTAHLHIGPPNTLDTAPTAFHFERARAVGIDWGEIVDAVATQDELAADARDSFWRPLKAYFERNWEQFRRGPVPARGGAPSQDTLFVAANTLFVPDFDTVLAVDADAADAIKNKRFPLHSTAMAERIPPTTEKALSLGAPALPPTTLVNVLRYRTSTGDRFFAPFALNGQGQKEYYTTQFELDPNLGGPAYTEAWKRMAGLDQVFMAEPGTTGDLVARNNFTAVDEINAAAAFVLREYEVYRALKSLADKQSAAMDRLLATNIDQAILDVDTWDDLSRRYLNATETGNLRAMGEMIRGRAANLGFVLFLEPKTVTYFAPGNPKGQQITLEPGTLYLRHPKVVTWVVEHRTTKRKWYGSKKTSVSRERHSRTFAYFERINVDWDPWREASAHYESAGYLVQQFLETANGYVTPNGDSLESVMQRCDADEAYRRRCVVALPRYEISITGKRVLIGYQFVFRPMAGVVAENPPEVLINERLSYRFAWVGTRLGELAATIPLAPNEERTVTLTRSVSREFISTESTSSVIELSSTTKTDFESTFEREVTREVEKTKDFKAEGSGASPKGKGSASFASNERVRDVSRTLNRVVRRTATEVSSRRRQEITASTSTKATESTSSSTSYKVSNVNSGRTLNLMFYRLYNDFESGLWLDDFSVTVEAGPPLVQGLEFRQSRTFNKQNIEEFVQWLSQMQLGVAVRDDKVETLRYLVLLAIFKQASAEYDSLCWRLPASLKQAGTSAAGTAPDAAKIAERTDRKSKLADDLKSKGLCAALLDSWIEDRPIDRSRFSVDSGGFYTDAIVGALAATEPYAERMRTLEERAKSAEVALTLAKAHLMTGTDSGSAAGLGGDWEVAGALIQPAASGKSSRVTYVVTGASLPDTGWSLQHISTGARTAPVHVQPGDPSFLAFELDVATDVTPAALRSAHVLTHSATERMLQ